MTLLDGAKAMSRRSCFLGMMAGMLFVAAYNSVEAEPQDYATNGAFVTLLFGLFVLNRFGFVYLAGSSTVDLTGDGSFLLISEELTAAFITMPLPIDLNNFKVISDSLGHYLDDRLLVEVSRRLSNCLRFRDSAARFGGSEFTILLANLWDAAGAIRVTKRLLEALTSLSSSASTRLPSLPAWGSPWITSTPHGRPACFGTRIRPCIRPRGPKDDTKFSAPRCTPKV
jgi:hypothetical protein